MANPTYTYTITNAVSGHVIGYEHNKANALELAQAGSQRWNAHYRVTRAANGAALYVRTVAEYRNGTKLRLVSR